MTNSFPFSQVPLSDTQGRPTAAWYRWFSDLAGASQPAQLIAIGTSPFSWTAPVGGTLFVSGGTISDISVLRGTTSVPTGVTAGPIPLGTDGVAVITFTVAPTLYFLAG